MSDLIRKKDPETPGDHVTPWLGAYLDGEVTSVMRERIEAHLEGCAICQAELESLEQLSVLLHSDPPLELRISDSTFARQIVEQIHHPAPPLWQRFLMVGWRLAPLVLFAAWAFFQAVGWVSGLILFGMNWVPGAEDTWQALMPFANGGGWLLSDLLRMSLSSLNLIGGASSVAWLEPTGVMALINMAFILILTVLFLSWLASWWAYRQARIDQKKD